MDDLKVKQFGTEGSNADEILSALKAADISVDNVYFTGMVKHGLGSKSKPSAEDIEAWATKLDEEIAEIKPKLIIPLGAEVFNRILRSNIKMGD